MIGLLIPSKLKLYALITGVIVLAFMGVYWQGGRDAAHRIEAKRDRNRLDSMKKAKEVRDEVDNSDDDDLIAGVLHK